MGLDVLEHVVHVDVVEFMVVRMLERYFVIIEDRTLLLSVKSYLRWVNDAKFCLLPFTSRGVSVHL